PYFFARNGGVIEKTCFGAHGIVYFQSDRDTFPSTARGTSGQRDLKVPVPHIFKVGYLGFQKTFFAFGGYLIQEADTRPAPAIVFVPVFLRIVLPYQVNFFDQAGVPASF